MNSPHVHAKEIGGTLHKEVGAGRQHETANAGQFEAVPKLESLGEKPRLQHIGEVLPSEMENRIHICPGEGLNQESVPGFKPAPRDDVPVIFHASRKIILRVTGGESMPDGSFHETGEAVAIVAMKALRTIAFN